MIPCFDGASSPPGSSSQQDCVCSLPNTVPLVQPGIQSRTTHTHTQCTYTVVTLLHFTGGFMKCVALPAGGMLSSSGDSLTCKPNWSVLSAYPKLACKLCDPGSFVMAIGEVCRACPADTYSASGVAVGGCTPCPNRQTTLGVTGAVSPTACSCPPGSFVCLLFKAFKAFKAFKGAGCGALMILL